MTIEEAINHGKEQLEIFGGEHREFIELALKALQEQRTGHWEYTTHYGKRYRVCSECRVEKEDDRATGWNYCLNCGAKMT